MASPADPLLYEHRFRSHRERQIYLPEEEGQPPLIARWRQAARDFLSSRRGHYLILLLVSVDVACTFADFLIELHVCELTKHGSYVAAGWSVTQEVLAIIGLVFSCLFMLELMVTVFSFGKCYFSSKFHVFDALVIIVAFGVDVALHGIEEELGSLIVVLRLWRVFKIIEELESANEDTLEEYEHEIERLRQDNTYLRQRLNVSLDNADPMD
ncbi:hypothetical protein BDV38DRAFT_27621 [Aspergillus pseudotamarii]|uniref:Voltage-gated hydrogen channel 1 n=1 Tax=Aspergillus pseudotamarii TaxID=132259 RepID=A0A5N6T1P6_ASPPS|nr:uncharacterized protein BDV38DRAFT_27621 [Aspergillus pseudotamarii]KAE8140209.1 hypothetical protein BDV38DRAFT_27621 [Aspergillus pseudotamarii]